MQIFMQIISVRRWCQVQSTDGADRRGQTAVTKFRRLKKKNAIWAHLQRRRIINMFLRVPDFFFCSASEKVRRLKVAAPQQPAGNCVSWGAARGSGPYFIESQSNCCFHSMTDLNGPLDHPPLVPLFVYKLSFFYSFSFLLVSINKFIGKF